jgi:thiol-disulfide isomerase/thioredoxin
MRFLFIVFLIIVQFGFKSYSQTNNVSFKVNGLHGKQVNIPDPDGRLVVVNFWSVYCRVCISEIPELNKLNVQYTDGNVLFLSVSADTKDEIVNFLTLNEYAFEPTYTDKRSFIDLSKLISGSIALPFTAIIDGKGKVLYQQGVVRELDLDKFRKTIDSSLSF